MMDNGSGKLIGVFKKKSDKIMAMDAYAGDYLWPGFANLIVIFLGAAGKISFGFKVDRIPAAAVR